MLKIKNLTVAYQGNNPSALNCINLHLKKGKITALVGESGSGKTTLANTILNSLPNSAKILDGQIYNSGDHPASLIYGKDVSYVSQNFSSSLSEYFTIFQQFDMLIKSKLSLKKSERKKMIIELIREFIPDVEDKIHKYPFELCGGEKQRILIAMAIAGNPSLLIADEPTSAIDSVTRSSLMDKLKEINQKLNITILVISHDLALVQKIADYTAVLYQGNLMEFGDGSIMKQKPRHPYSKMLIASRPDLKKNILIEKKILHPESGHDCPFATFCPDFDHNCSFIINNNYNGNFCACSKVYD
jgi:ABC-type glutathione transport system ATPase component